MIRGERLLKVLKAPHISEKSTMVAEKQNTIVFKIAVDATKAEVKAAVAKLFEVEVETVRTLICCTSSYVSLSNNILRKSV